MLSRTASESEHSNETTTASNELTMKVVIIASYINAGMLVKMPV
jgi:hypothetical protein